MEEDMGISHRMVDVNGIKMHIAEKGEGPVVLLVHGFPSLWYSWRHQILSLAASGFRAVAPDLRGYGDTDAPTSPQSYTCFHIVGDLVALIDTLGQDKVFVVGHDWGAIISWYLCLFRPDKVKALVNLSVAFTPRRPTMKPLDALKAMYGNDYYIIHFQEPGEMEAVFARVGTETILKNFLTRHSPAPLMISKDEGFPTDVSITLPSWLSEEDICYYTSKYEKSGFTGGFNSLTGDSRVFRWTYLPYQTGDEPLQSTRATTPMSCTSPRGRDDIVIVVLPCTHLYNFFLFNNTLP